MAIKTEVNISEKLSKAQKKRLKKKDASRLKIAAKAINPQKRKSKESKLSSSIQLPSQAVRTDEFIPTLDSEEKRIEAARSRLVEMSTNILQIRPVPKLCPPGLIKELCPLAVSIRFPSKSGARYAFLHFRNSHECESALKQLTGRQLNGKEIKISASRSNNDACKEEESWVKPADRQAGDFNWRQLFVTKLARSTKRFDLAQVFRTASNIQLDTYDDGSCRGTCILKYQSEADALEAFETRHGTVIHGCPIHVNFVLLSKQTKDKQKQTTEQDVEMAEADQTVSN